MSTSVIIAVHNEEKHLPYFLPNLFGLHANEFIFVLDRCNDNSKHLIQTVHHPETAETKIVDKQFVSWKNSPAETQDLGCQHATGETIFMLDADIIPDKNLIEKTMPHFKDAEIVAFTYKNYTLHGSVFQRVHDELVNFMARIIRKSGIQPKRSGLYAIKKQNAKIRDADSEYDELQRKHETKLIKTNILHLRPGLSKEKQMSQGRVRAQLPQYNLLKILLASLLLFKPYMLIAYLQTKMM